mmetsp:Transcript_9606/g.16056  ORF Transcript_9606/g.16056 Transcript_9606/m.16056 type:complete len:105 (-) Transcript_9606:261-575(-)
MLQMTPFPLHLPTGAQIKFWCDCGESHALLPEWACWCPDERQLEISLRVSVIWTVGLLCLGLGVTNLGGMGLNLQTEHPFVMPSPCHERALLCQQAAVQVFFAR